MHSAHRSRLVHAPVDRVLTVLDDIDGRPDGQTAESTPVRRGSEPESAGDHGRAQYYGGQLEQALLTPHGESVDSPAFGSYPLVATVVDVTVQEADDHHSLVTLTAHFQPKYGILGWVVGRVILEQRFETHLDALLDGLAAHLRATHQAGGTDTPATA